MGHPRHPGPTPRRAGHPAPTPHRGLGPELPHPDQLPARLPGPTAAETRTRTLPPPIPDHRTRHGLPLRNLARRPATQNGSVTASKVSAATAAVFRTGVVVSA